MKKNWAMRAAILMVALTLITSCFVSGTFAKYVTAGSAADTARVAKFGVIIESDGSLFSKTYVQVADGNIPGTSNLTVESSDDDKLVAPGTQSADEGLKVTVTGTPEVKVNVAIVVTADDDVFLKAGTYADMTQAPYTDTFDLDDDYYPVQYTLTRNGTAVVTDGTIAEIEAELEDLSGDKDANTVLDNEIGELVLTWKWVFDGNDKADTLLGDLAAGLTIDPAVDADDYNLITGLTISVTVTQID